MQEMSRLDRDMRLHSMYLNVLCDLIPAAFWSSQDDPTKCVIFFTGGVGWNLEETMQKATAWNMPLAPLVAKTWGNFTGLARQIPSTFYWWVLGRQVWRVRESLVGNSFGRSSSLQTIAIFLLSNFFRESTSATMYV